MESDVMSSLRDVTEKSDSNRRSLGVYTVHCSAGTPNEWSLQWKKTSRTGCLKDSTITVVTLPIGIASLIGAHQLRKNKQSFLTNEVR